MPALTAFPRVPRVGGRLHCGAVPIEEIVHRYGTPVYVYNADYFEQRYRALTDALGGLDHRICYSVKANSNIHVLQRFAQLGAGFDIVSGGELERVLQAGGAPERIVFSGVGKSTAEIDYALKQGIGCFNVESRGELERLAERAGLLGRIAPVALRVNPNVDAATHPYISTGLKENKFGVPPGTALELCRWAHAHPALQVQGLDCHIGSQIETLAPLTEALASLLELHGALQREGIGLAHLDLGGGLGVTYKDEVPFDVYAYGARLRELLGGRGLQLILEPGRYLVAGGGVLITRVEYLKTAAETGFKNFAVVDAGMNDFIRPALYQAWHRIEAVNPEPSSAPVTAWDVVGPVCESGDFFARDRELALTPGALLAIFDVGAYGLVQASNYNTRGRPPEVMTSNGEFRLIRRRETVRDLLATELDVT
jgi:diaminopimelate decarboxylase